MKMTETGEQVATEARNPLLGLDEEDLNMVAEFVLVSGSIKDLAARYRVSYPTMPIALQRQDQPQALVKFGEPAGSQPCDAADKI